MSDLTGISVQGHTPIMWNGCIPVLVGILLIAMSSYEVYILHSCLINAHRVIGICGI